MTRDEYFITLKNNIQSLSVDEQNEALQYYSDYFDDAGDDQKAMEELGNPEDVAKEIREKFSNALVAEKQETEEKREETSSSGTTFGALYYEFAENEVKNIDFGFGAAEIVFITGNKFCVETRGISSENFDCHIDNNGTLVAKNLKNLSRFRFWEHSANSRIVPRILISIPENVKLGYVKISLGAGKLSSKAIDLSFEKGVIEVGAGNLVIGNINGKNTNLRCGMGNMEIKGTFTARTNIDCGMGSIKLLLNQNLNASSYDAKIGLGSFKFNDFQKSGVNQINCNEQRENHFSVNVGMGSVAILMNK